MIKRFIGLPVSIWKTETSAPPRISNISYRPPTSARKSQKEKTCRVCIRVVMLIPNVSVIKEFCDPMPSVFKILL